MKPLFVAGLLLFSLGTAFAAAIIAKYGIVDGPGDPAMGFAAHVAWFGSGCLISVGIFLALVNSR